jgi:hypothetical protein
MKKIFIFLILVTVISPFKTASAFDFIRDIMIQLFADTAVDTINSIDNPKSSSKSSNSEKMSKEKAAEGCLQIYNHSNVSKENEQDLFMKCKDACKDEIDKDSKLKCEYRWLFDEGL